MPRFRYRCQDCLTEFYYLIISANDLPSCPQCNNQKKLQKLPTTFGTISDDTRFDTSARDLPSMKEFHNKKDKPPKKLDRNEIFKDF